VPERTLLLHTWLSPFWIPTYAAIAGNSNRKEEKENS